MKVWAHKFALAVYLFQIISILFGFSNTFFPIALLAAAFFGIAYTEDRGIGASTHFIAGALATVAATIFGFGGSHAWGLGLLALAFAILVGGSLARTSQARAETSDSGLVTK